jgi:hypothetical protein
MHDRWMTCWLNKAVGQQSGTKVCTSPVKFEWGMKRGRESLFGKAVDLGLKRATAVRGLKYFNAPERRFTS